MHLVTQGKTTVKESSKWEHISETKWVGRAVVCITVNSKSPVISDSLLCEKNARSTKVKQQIFHFYDTDEDIDKSQRD